MTSSGDPDGPALIESGADIVIALRDKREGGKGIQMCQGARRLLKRGDPLCTGIPYAAECIIFQGVELVLCVEDTVLQFLEALGRITFGADQGLFADIIVGYKIFKGIGDLKIVSENLVVFDPQIFDACSLPVLCLQIHQPLAAVVAGIPQMVDIRIIAGFDDSSLSDRERRFIHNGLIQKLCQV